MPQHIYIPKSAYSFFITDFAEEQPLLIDRHDIILLTDSEEDCLIAYAQCKFFSPRPVYYFPSLDIEIYGRSFSSLKTLMNRTKILTDLVRKTDASPRIIIMHGKNLIKKLPPLDIFKDNSILIETGKILIIANLLDFLVQNGFTRSASAMDPGEFAVRGQIVDIVLDIDKGYRVLFDINIIEEIKIYDLNTQISSNIIDEFTIFPINEIIFNTDTLTNFRNNYLKNFGVNNTKDPIFLSIMEGRKFPGYENLLPLFYTKLVTITAYLNSPVIIHDWSGVQSIIDYIEEYHTSYDLRIASNKKDKNNFYPSIKPEELLLTIEESKALLIRPDHILIGPYDPRTPDRFMPFAPLLNHLLSKERIESLNNEDYHISLWAVLTNFIKENIHTKTIFILCKLKSSIEKIKNIITSSNLQYVEITSLNNAKFGFINIALIDLDYGFITPQHLFIPYCEIFQEKSNMITSSSNQSAKKRLKNILIELEGIEPGEYVIHKEHGIGKFLALENVIVEGTGHDCIKILYADNAKLYIPVENIENIKKYGFPDAELDKLGGASWQKRKSKIKERVTEIAGKLLQLAAKRKSQTTNPVIMDIDAYTKFCNKFHYIETEDQLRAIEEVRQDLFSGKIMDRLICGDVGFGKTEVALRAAFLVASDKSDYVPQVAIIVPTTILCKQHYRRFIERFEGTNLNLAEISRFVPINQISSIKEKLANGKVNIVIGTHALLNKDIKFYNLKLVIIDEEQHFGVIQKERLKELKADIHVLSLSATPIPRTLQMSMVGLKDLSLIATPPMDRLPIRTMILPFDFTTIKEALLKEYSQGGKSFYVVPRIEDIVEVEKRIISMVPELTYKIIHGGLPASHIDKIMSEFYNDKIDILLSTAIIESGIDIATANTIIIHKADQFGLAQIYQLRGRIGRGNQKAFAYFTLEKNKITEKAQKRLEIMQNIENTGGGFTVASYDMDFRGFGNLVGEQQAGHIKEVGIELYQEMLDEQMTALEPSNSVQGKEFLSPAINLGIPVFINENYISDSSLRLGIYRRLGNLSTNEEIDNFANEMIDRFGPLPTEFGNLIGILRIKLLCIQFYIESLDVTDKGAVFKFYNKDVQFIIDSGDLDTMINESTPMNNRRAMRDEVSKVTSIDYVMNFINKFPGKAKMKPNNKLIFIQNFNKNNVINEVLELLCSIYSQ